MNFHGNDLFLLSGQQQIAQVAYKSPESVNGPFVVNLATVLKTLFPSYNYFRFRSARISVSYLETGQYTGYLKLIPQDGVKTTAISNSEAASSAGYTIPAYFSGSFLPLPLSYLDKWYSTSADVTYQQAPSFTLYVYDGTKRAVQLNSAATIFLKISVTATIVAPNPSTIEPIGGGGGPSLASVKELEESQEEEEEEPVYVSEARKALKKKMALAQEMLKDEQSDTSQIKAFALSSSYPWYNYNGTSGPLKKIVYETKIRARDKYEFNTGYGQSSIEYLVDLSQLVYVKTALVQYKTIVFKELTITITPKNINRSGSHCAVTPYMKPGYVGTESTNIWYRVDPGDYRFVWNRYQPGPFTPFPHLYLDQEFNGTIDSPIPSISLQFSGWADSDIMYIFIDYKIALNGLRNGNNQDVGGGGGISLSSTS